VERKRLRHPSIDYSEPGRAFSVTIATRDRIPVFRDVSLGLRSVDLLRRVCERSRTKVFAYCLMPDHAHLLLGLGTDVSLPSLLGAWKSLTYRARRGLGKLEPMWQRSFFDHALRRDEDLQKAAEYILNNPVRDRLVKARRDYPLCGSFEFDV
jgi:REP element-mobilizing transposase RayT